MNISLKNLIVYGSVAVVCMYGQTVAAKTVKQPTAAIQFTVNASIPSQANNVKVVLDPSKANNGSTVKMVYGQPHKESGMTVYSAESDRYLKVTLPANFPGSKVSLMATSNVKYVNDGNNFPLKTPSGTEVPTAFLLNAGNSTGGIYEGTQPVDIADFTKAGEVSDVKVTLADKAYVHPSKASKVAAGASGTLAVTLSITPEIIS